MPISIMRGFCPKLVKHGFAGRIHCTQATADLCGIMLPDSGIIQEMEVKQLNQRRVKRGEEEVEPIYTLEDAMAALEHFEGHGFETWIDAGARHPRALLECGPSAGLGLDRGRGRAGRRKAAPPAVLGRSSAPTTRCCIPTRKRPPISTSSSANRPMAGATASSAARTAAARSWRSEVNEAAKKKGALLIPSFAVERTQELVTDLVKLMDEGKVPKANIFID